MAAPGGLLVGLTGAIGSGKSLTAEYLTQMYCGTKQSFASPLKAICIEFGFTDSQIYGTQEQKKEINEIWGISGREFMQKLGTEVFRDAVPDIIPELHHPWLRIMENKARRLLADQTFVVIDDVRFIDEAVLVTQLKGVLIRIIRPCDTDKPTIVGSNIHASEKQDFTVNYTVLNNGSVDDLYDQIDKVMSFLGWYPIYPRSHAHYNPTDNTCK